MQKPSNFPKLRKFGGVASWFYKLPAFWTAFISWWASWTTLRCKWDEQKWDTCMCYAYFLLLNVCSSGKHQPRKEQRGRSKVQEQRPYPSMYSSWEMQQQSRSQDWTLTSSTAQAVNSDTWRTAMRLWGCYSFSYLKLVLSWPMVRSLWPSVDTYKR